MKILLSEIRDESREFRRESSLILEGLEERIGEVQIQARILVEPAGDRWNVRAELGAEYPMRCDRCSGQFQDRLETEFQRTVLRKEVEGLEEGEDVIILPYESQEVDLLAPLREALLLALPLQLLCRDDCAGLCPHCGQDLNQGSCDCEKDPGDSRWGPLLELKKQMEQDKNPGSGERQE
ncbi:MAG: DUF177 domain-containing protein [Candidatus Krumholzibacteria bacterium]|nr:DUF177 domain-containing protein [Candidatus Krumholzibacteria bacterium]MDP6797641.1 DUF177 domain-containing protein [Candidatus Krumholzibacteria bacterium]MDP7020767.1 DUF177 domain-containing protein [Candidatus Krumholzibacteria bacterium]